MQSHIDMGGMGPSKLDHLSDPPKRGFCHLKEFVVAAISTYTAWINDPAYWYRPDDTVRRLRTRCWCAVDVLAARRAALWEPAAAAACRGRPLLDALCPLRRAIMQKAAAWPRDTTRTNTAACTTADLLPTPPQKKMLPDQWARHHSNWRFVNALVCYIGPPTHTLGHIVVPLATVIVLCVGIKYAEGKVAWEVRRGGRERAPPGAQGPRMRPPTPQPHPGARCVRCSSKRLEMRHRRGGSRQDSVLA